jgi:Protein of unknown function (DUF1569)
MNPELEKLLQSFDRATHGMSPAQLQWLPAELREQKKWCVAQILEHLSLTYSGTEGVMRKIVASGACKATRPSVRQRLGIFVVLDLGFLPGGREAPDRVVPRSANPDTVVRVMHDNLIAMDCALSECERCFGGRVKVVDHPVLGALTVPQWRRFHAVHGRHHLRQIEGLKQRQGIATVR